MVTGALHTASWALEAEAASFGAAESGVGASCAHPATSVEAASIAAEHLRRALRTAAANHVHGTVQSVVGRNAEMPTAFGEGYEHPQAA